MNPESMLVTDEERDQAVATLRTACVDGKLSMEEYAEKVERAVAVQSRAQLSAVMEDLWIVSCSYCGVRARLSDSFCPNCGTRLSSPAQPPARTQGSVQACAPAPALREPVRDPSVGFLLEILPGLFGFLGLGHMYSGQVARGVAFMLVYWAFLFVELMLLMMVVGICLLPFNLLIPIGSAFWLKGEMDRCARLAPPVQAR